MTITAFIICIVVVAIGIALIKTNSFICSCLGSFIIICTGMFCATGSVDGLKSTLKNTYSSVKEEAAPKIDTLSAALQNTFDYAKPTTETSGLHAGLKIVPNKISDEEVNEMLKKMNLPKADTSYYDDKTMIIRIHQESLIRGDFPPDEEFEKEYKVSGCKWFSIGNTEYVKDGQYDRIVYYKN